MGTCMSGYNMQCLTMDIVGNAFGEAHALSKIVDFEKEQAQCSHRDKRRTYYWLARNQDNVSEWGDMSIIRRLFFQCASTIKIQLSVLV
jgi:hypothetical protein